MKTDLTEETFCKKEANIWTQNPEYVSYRAVTFTNC